MRQQYTGTHFQLPDALEGKLEQQSYLYCLRLKRINGQIEDSSKEIHKLKESVEP